MIRITGKMLFKAMKDLATDQAGLSTEFSVREDDNYDKTDSQFKLVAKKLNAMVAAKTAKEGE